jgi:hypothetical protein
VKEKRNEEKGRKEDEGNKMMRLHADNDQQEPRTMKNEEKENKYLKEGVSVQYNTPYEHSHCSFQII